MKILMINKFFFVVGGVERYLHELSRVLERHGHQVVPFAMRHERNYPSKWERFFVSRIEFRDLGLGRKLTRGPALAGRVLWSREASKALGRLIDEVRPDVAHLHMIDHQLSPSVLHVLRERGVPALQTAHNYKLVCPNYRLYVPRTHELCERCVGGNHLWPLVTRCHMDSLPASALVVLESYLHRWLRSYDHVRRFHAPSRFLAERLARSGIAAERIWQHPLTLDLERYAFSEEFDDYALYLGRLTPEKGVLTLLRAMRSLPGVRLRVLGEGPQGPALQRYAAEHGLDRVEFSGFLSGDALRRAVSRARVVVVPSEWHDNLPMAIHESMALGRPVVGTSLGGIPELVRDGVNGQIVPPGDAAALADVLASLMDDLPRLRAMGRAGREIAEAEFDPQDHAAQMLDQYRSLAA